jgi:hypothetical protein
VGLEKGRPPGICDRVVNPPRIPNPPA